MKELQAASSGERVCPYHDGTGPGDRCVCSPVQRAVKDIQGSAKVLADWIRSDGRESYAEYPRRILAGTDELFSTIRAMLEARDFYFDELGINFDRDGGYDTALQRRRDELEGLNATIRQHEETIGKLSARISDYEASAMRVLSGQCASDEKHCACVPYLRDEIATQELIVEQNRVLYGNQINQLIDERDTAYSAGYLQAINDDAAEVRGLRTQLADRDRTIAEQRATIERYKRAASPNGLTNYDLRLRVIALGHEIARLGRRIANQKRANRFAVSVVGNLHADVERLTAQLRDYDRTVSGHKASIGRLTRERDEAKAEADRRTHELNLSCKVQIDLNERIADQSKQIQEGAEIREHLRREVATFTQLSRHGTPNVRLALIGQFADSEFGHSPYAAEPPENAIFAGVADLRAKLTAAESRIATLENELRRTVEELRIERNVANLARGSLRLANDRIAELLSALRIAMETAEASVDCRLRDAILPHLREALEGSEVKS